MAGDGQQNLRIFLASPSDVEAERRIAYKVIDDVKNILQIIKSQMQPSPPIPQLTAIGWEDVPPGVGLPNTLILEKFPIEESDIVIGIFWKRYGSPPGTRRPDGKKYKSGTEEEITRAFKANQEGKRGNRPVIMLYQKKDTFSLPSGSKKDVEQYKRVVEFFEQCQVGGKHPALTYAFESKDFERILFKHLLEIILKLVKDQSQSDVPQDGEIAYKHWFEKNNLFDNPFHHRMAEEEENLVKYYVRFGDLAIRTNDIISDKKNWLVFGREGSGKTALRKFLASRCYPARDDAKVLALEYGESEFDTDLQSSSNVPAFTTNFARHIFNMGLKAKNIQSTNTPDLNGSSDPTHLLQQMVQTLGKIGTERILCLIDPGIPTGSDKPRGIDALAQVAALSITGISFRLFLPKSIHASLMRQQEYLGKCNSMEIKWSEKDLHDLIQQRLMYYSINKQTQNQSIGSLCEPRIGTIDNAIIKLSEENPRAVIWLADQLFITHCQNSPDINKIQIQAWETVQQNWWTTGRNLILGTSGEMDGFLVAGDDVYFKNDLLDLSKRSKALIKCLVEAEGQICSKERLVHAAWPPEEDKTGVTEPALREAMRRLKVELGDDKKDWIKTVHNQGYRLQAPNAGVAS